MHDGMVLPDLSRSCKACVWQAQNAAAAAAEEAGAEAQHSTQLQEQLQDTKAGCTSLAVALSSEQVARTKAERQAAECQQRARDQSRPDGLSGPAAEQGHTGGSPPSVQLHVCWLPA